MPSTSGAGSERWARSASRPAVRFSSIIASNAAGVSADRAPAAWPDLGLTCRVDPRPGALDRGHELSFAPLEADQDRRWSQLEIAGDGLDDAAVDGALDVGVEALLSAVGVELDVDTDAPPPIVGDTSDRWTEPEVVKNHGSDLEDEVPGRGQCRLHQLAQRFDLVDRPRVLLLDKPIHDLRLEADVGDGLGRAVVELTNDLTAQVLLAAHDGGRLVHARRAAATGGAGQRSQAGGGHRSRSADSFAHGCEAIVDLDEALQEACQHALLALEHLALGVEEQLPSRQGQQVVASLHRRRRIHGCAGFEAGETGFHLGAASVVALDLGEDLLHEHVDLTVLAVDAADVLFELLAESQQARLRGADARPDRRRTRGGWLRSAQSSGILIQPCFMA